MIYFLASKEWVEIIRALLNCWYIGKCGIKLHVVIQAWTAGAHSGASLRSQTVNFMQGYLISSMGNQFLG